MDAAREPDARRVNQLDVFTRERKEKTVDSQDHIARGRALHRWLLAVALGLVLVLGLTSVADAASPPMAKWVDPLPVPPVATQTFNKSISGWADYYEITMSASQHQFNSGLPGPATVWTYGQPGKTPVLLGPTIVATSGRPVVVKYINNLPTGLGNFPLKDSIDPTIPGAPGFGPGEVPPGAAIPHLHGGHTAARFDGTPEQWWTANGKTGPGYVTDTFTYLNDQPASLLWYHDHTMGATRFKPYLGLAAAYVIFDKVDNGTTINGQKVPSGYGTYHLPLVLQDKQFNDDGTLFYPTEGISLVHPIWVPEFFGDTPVINGQAYPKLDAQPRRYRLRLLNGSQARFYNLHFKSGDTPAPGVVDSRVELPFWVIGSEQGLLPAPAQKTSLLIAPGERFDVIVDFTGIPLGSTVMMTNDANAPYPDGTDEAPVPDLMKINVNTAVPANDPDRTVLPAKLKLPGVPRLDATPRLARRDIVLKENTDEFDNPIEVLLNGYSFMDPTTDFIKAGTTETWQWINLTVDAHPMHPHLVASQVVNRQAIDVVAYTAAWQAYLDSGRKSPKPNVDSYLIGRPIPPSPEEMGYKDTVKAYPGMVTRTRAKFTLPATSRLDYDWKTQSFGSWVYHCHILEHEENDMMRPFVVVK
jgi:spore coat protein A